MTSSQVKRRRLARTLGFCRFSPPGKIVGEPREITREQVSGLADRLTIRIKRLGNPATLIALEITTIPISDSVPCQSRLDRAPANRPAE